MSMTKRVVRAGLAASATATFTLGAAGAAGAAGATPPGPGVVGTVIAQKTVGDTDYILREITIPAGQSTGWHYHDGMLYGKVKQGTLSHFDDTCASDGIYRRGSVIREPAGSEHVHVGVNRGRSAVVLEVLYVLPTGSPLSRDAANPGCSFQ